MNMSGISSSVSQASFEHMTLYSEGVHCQRDTDKVVAYIGTAKDMQNDLLYGGPCRLLSNFASRFEGSSTFYFDRPGKTHMHHSKSAIGARGCLPRYLWAGAPTKQGPPANGACGGGGQVHYDKWLCFPHNICEHDPMRGVCIGQARKPGPQEDPGNGFLLEIANVTHLVNQAPNLCKRKFSALICDQDTM